MMTRFGPLNVYRELPARLLVSGVLVTAMAALAASHLLSAENLVLVSIAVSFALIGAFKGYARRHRLANDVITALAPRSRNAMARADRSIRLMAVSMDSLLRERPLMAGELESVIESPSRRLFTIFLSASFDTTDATRNVINVFCLSWESFLSHRAAEILELRAAATQSPVSREVFVFDDDVVMGCAVEQTFEDVGLPVRRLPTPPHLRTFAWDLDDALDGTTTFITYREPSAVQHFLPLAYVEREVRFMNNLVTPLSDDFARGVAAYLGAIVKIGLWRQGKLNLDVILENLPSN